MGLFNWLVSGRKVEKDKIALVEQMKSMATEAERVYRNFIQIYSNENNVPVPVSGRGLFKARLHAVLFMVHAFVMRWPDKEDDAMELANIASGVAIMSLVDLNSNPRFERDEAKTFALDYMKGVIVGVTKEFKMGSSQPNHESQVSATLPNCTTRHCAILLDSQHIRLTSKIASTIYLVKSGIASGLHHITKVAAQL